ncbi:MAG: hypothetical protein ACI4TE_00665 [Alphaproteobacteria bacterium]
MTQAERGRFKKASEISRFVLFNFHSLKTGNAEHLHSLAELSGLKEIRISEILRSCYNEIEAVNYILASIG